MTTERPYTLIAELTYNCPLRCVYCSNPTDAARHAGALETDSWRRVFREAADLGVVHLNITSGVPLDRPRLARLRESGLDSVQLSFQDARAGDADRMAGVAAFEQKLSVAAWVKELGLPLAINVVLHRENLDSMAHVIELAERLQADRLELANTQYLGWALLNRPALLPTRDQLER